MISSKQGQQITKASLRNFRSDSILASSVQAFFVKSLCLTTIVFPRSRNMYRHAASFG